MIEKKELKVLVIGESCDDIFIYGDVLRLSPEAPVPVIKPLREVYSKGMAENVELNLKSLGVDTQLICNTEEVVKIRYVDNSYNYILLRIDENDEVSNLNLRELPNLNDFDLVVFADYDKGFLSKDDIEEISSNCNCPTFLDTKKKLGNWCKHISFIKINYHEYLRSKDKIDNNGWLKNKTIITRGPNGCDFNGKNYPTKEVSVKDVAGAGDSFLAGLIFKYIHTYNIEESIEFANKCSTQVVQKRGVSIINKDEI
jgi:D-beta-D-heptose 7-phosphate kinase/D-beta-D-heptose 1-phosphate adenosyltransferase